MNDKNYDVIISGCGPAGSLLGYYLAGSSVKTLIIEKEEFPRHKTCAGGIQHRAIKLLPFSIDPVIERVINGIYFSLKNEKKILKKNDSPLIYTVKRPDFDNFLASKAAENGAEIRFGQKVTGYEHTGSHIVVKTEYSKYRCKILAGADGVRGAVHRQLAGNCIRKILGYETEIDLDAKEKTKDAAPAINFNSLKEKLIYEDATGNIFDFTDNLRLDFGGVKKGYCWVFPKSDTLSCGIGAPFVDAKKIKSYFASFLKKFLPPLSYREGSHLKIYAHTIPIMDKNTKFFTERVIALGDAACFADGFTGEGLYNCFRSAAIAKICIMNALNISDFSFNDYYEKINDTIYREIKSSIILTRLFYTSLNFLYKIVTENDRLFSSCCSLIRGEKSYDDAIKRLGFFKF